MPLLGRRSRLRRGLRGLAALAAILAVGFVPRPAGSAETRSKLTLEYDLKAAFLFNFAQFVEWPDQAFPDAATPVTIGVLGEDPFGESLEQTVAVATVGDRRLVIRRFKSVDEIGTCHILFISASEAPRLDADLASLVGRSILTVGETTGFAAKSGMVGFVLSQNRLKLQVNLAAVRAAKLTISSKLLRQAQIVGAESKSK